MMQLSAKRITPWLVFLLFIAFHPNIQGQENRLADSLMLLVESDNISVPDLVQFYKENGVSDVSPLIKIYEEKQLSDQERLQVLEEITFNGVSFLEGIMEFSHAQIKLAKELGDTGAWVRGLLSLGDNYENIGDFTQSLTQKLEAVRIADSANYEGRANAYNSIAYLLSRTRNFLQAEKYFQKAVNLQLEIDPDNAKYLMSMYYNLGEIYLKRNKLDSAYTYLEKSKQFAEQLNDNQYDPYFEGNHGVYLMKKGNLREAEEIILSAAQKMKDINPPAYIEYYNYLTDLAQKEGDLQKGLYYANTALSMGKEINASVELIPIYYNLYELNKAQNEPALALEFFEKFNTIYNSTINLTAIQEINNLRNEFDLANKQKEVDLMAKEAEIQEIRANKSLVINIISGILVLLLSLLIFGLFNRFKYIRKTSKIIEAEKERSDRLLKNILPEETADELKASGRVKAKKFESVSVLFADFKGFTKYSEDMDPEELVRRVDFYFSKFDEIMEKFDLEKIKTMGDAYMCAGGLPFPSDDHALRMVMAAFEMVDFVQKIKEEDPDDPTRFELRIGINTGPVVAGVVGTKKFVYDIWGDTVNIASRMESNSEPGRINVSENTYQLIKHKFDCDFRGMVDVKHKGMMRMYFIEHLPKEKQEAVYREYNLVSG